MSDDLYTGGGYAEKHPNWHREHSAWKAGQILALLRRQAAKPGTVAEVGCGAGAILAELQRALPPATRFTGYEIAPAAVALAAPLANDRLSFVLGDFVVLALPPVDLLLAIDVVEHVPEAEAFLRALRPRARAHLFHLPLDRSCLSQLQPERLRWARESVGHVHFFTAASARALLRKTGYTVVAERYTAVELDLPLPAGQRQRLRGLRRLGRRVSPALTARVLGGFSLLLYCRP